jgi:replicative DNA helicase
MASADEHAVVVLSAVLPARRDLLDKMLRSLTPAHFEDKVHETFFRILERYYGLTGGVLTKSALEDSLRNKDLGQQQLYSETYEYFETNSVGDDEFVWSVDQLRELATEREVGAALTEAMEILRVGVESRDGEMRRGQQAARDALAESMTVIDRELLVQDTPEGDIREEKTDILADYAERKHARESGQATGVNFGITELDARVGGMQNGELVISAAYSSDGKTTLCTQAAWSASFEQGKNVVFLTTETTRVQVRRKMVARHSMLPQFGIPQGINSDSLKKGTLTAQEEKILPDIVADMEKNPSYGKSILAQVPRGATISYIEQVLMRYQRQFDVDFAVMDYLALLSAGRNRSSSREELSGIMKDAKVMATSFADGRGLPFMSPWQVNRASREMAEKMGAYTTAALAETAESTNSADLIISLLAPTEKERRAELTMQILKNRDGETANGMLVEVDYATSYFRSKTGAGQFAPIGGGTNASNNNGGLDGLLGGY